MAPLGDMDSTGFADEFEGTITRAYFDKDKQYNADALTMKWVVKDNHGDNEYTLLFSMGIKGEWDTPDNGKTARSNKFSRPVKGTVYAGLCTWCMNNLDMQDELRKRFTNIEDGGIEFLDAAGWNGLRFQFRVMKPADIGLEYKRLDDRANRSRLWPIKFAGCSVTDDSPAPKETVAEKVKRLEKEMPYIRRLEDIAATCDTFDQFVVQALSLEGLDTCPALQARVLDPDDFWRSAKK